MSNDVVLVERRGAVGWITINRPEAHNAINEGVRNGLSQTVRNLDSDPDIRVMVLRGGGDRAFCAGADIKEFSADQMIASYRQNRVHDHWIAAFDTARKPIIAAIHGYCLGGGLEIASACDIRIAARGAVIGLPEVGLGIMTGAGGSQRLIRIVGQGRLMDLMLTCHRIDADEAYRIGLVTRLTDPESLWDEAQRIAEGIAGRPPLAVELAKEAVRRGTDLAFADGLRMEVDQLSLLMTTDDRLEAAAAFREKRPPKFTGR